MPLEKQKMLRSSTSHKKEIAYAGINPHGFPFQAHIIRGYESGRENYEFDPSIGNFFLVRCKKK